MSQSKLQWFEIEHKKRMSRHYKDKKKMKQTRIQKPRLTLYIARNMMKNLKYQGPVLVKKKIQRGFQEMKRKIKMKRMPRSKYESK